MFSSVKSDSEIFGALKANYKAVRPRPSNLDEIKFSVENLFETRNHFFERMKSFILLGMTNNLLFHNKFAYIS